MNEETNEKEGEKIKKLADDEPIALPKLESPKVNPIPTVAQKEALEDVAVESEEGKIIEIPRKWGDRGVQKKLIDSLVDGVSTVWGSRVLVLLVIIVISCVYLGTDLMAFFSINEVMVEVDRNKVNISLQQWGVTPEGSAGTTEPPKLKSLKVEAETEVPKVEAETEVPKVEAETEAPKEVVKLEPTSVQIPIKVSSGWVAIIGHLILVVLSIRCLMLLFRKERNSLDYSLTQF